MTIGSGMASDPPAALWYDRPHAPRTSRVGVTTRIAVDDTMEHWNLAYARRGVTGVSWYEPTPRVSWEIISSLGVPLDGPVVDVGGGASGLAEVLVRNGYSDVTVVDVSDLAVREVEPKASAALVVLRQNVLTWQPTRRYQLWHDRAVFHFFVEPERRDAYLRVLDASLTAGAFVVLGVFAPDGPDRCSGLRVQRYDQDDLQRLLGEKYAIRVASRATHVTPGGVKQPFTWVAFQRQM